MSATVESIPIRDSRSGTIAIAIVVALAIGAQLWDSRNHSMEGLALAQRFRIAQPVTWDQQKLDLMTGRVQQTLAQLERAASSRLHHGLAMTYSGALRHGITRKKAAKQTLQTAKMYGIKPQKTIEKSRALGKRVNPVRTGELKTRAPSPSDRLRAKGGP